MKVIDVEVSPALPWRMEDRQGSYRYRYRYIDRYRCRDTDTDGVGDKNQNKMREKKRKEQKLAKSEAWNDFQAIDIIMAWHFVFYFAKKKKLL